MCRSLLTLLLLPLLSFAAPESVDDGHGFQWSDSVQDTAGVTWIALSDGSGDIGRRQNGEWVNEKPGEFEGQQLDRRLFALRDGSVVCLWSAQGYTRALSRHRVGVRPVVLPFAALLPEPALLERSNGALLLTGASPAVVEISPANQVRVLRLPEELYQARRPAKEGAAQSYAPVCAAEDDAHEVWLWSYALAEDPRQAQLLNFVLYADGGFSRRTIEGLEPAASLSAGVKMGGALWFAKVGAGLYRLPPGARTGEELTAGLRGRWPVDGVEHVAQLFSEGDDCFAVTGPRPPLEVAAPFKEGLPLTVLRGPMALPKPARYFHDPTQPAGRLLRYHAGTWEEILSGLDQESHGPWRERPHVMTPAGLLLGSVASGPWLALQPGGRPAVRQGWETAFSYLDAVRLQPRGGGRLRIITSAGESAVVPIEPAQEPRETSFLRQPWLEIPLVDVAGQFWGFRQPAALSRWDGAAWHEVAVPAEVAGRAEEVAWFGDDRNQGWYLRADGRAATCDLATGRWTCGTWESLMVEQLPRGPSQAGDAGAYIAPIFSGDGRIAYLRPEEGLHYYDGARWRQWSLNEIGGALTELNGRAFFHEKHGLCLALSGHFHHWAVTEERWLAFAPGEFSKPAPRFLITRVPDRSLEGNGAQASMADELGAVWFIDLEGRLNKGVRGRAVSLERPGEATPFLPAREMLKVLVDARGGALFLLGSDYAVATRPQYYYLPPRLPLPETAATLVENSEGRVRVQLSSPTTATPALEVWYAWQLDGAPWQPVQRAAELVLTELPAGPHRLLVRAYNADLGVDRTPAVLEWTGQAAPAKPLKAWIADLSAPTREKREAAVKYLRAQGAAALPLLREALAGGNVEAAWWLERAIGEIEGDLKASAAMKGRTLTEQDALRNLD